MKSHFGPHSIAMLRLCALRHSWPNILWLKEQPDLNAVCKSGLWVDMVECIILYRVGVCVSSWFIFLALFQRLPNFYGVCCFRRGDSGSSLSPSVLLSGPSLICSTQIGRVITDCSWIPVCSMWHAYKIPKHGSLLSIIITELIHCISITEVMILGLFYIS